MLVKNCHHNSGKDKKGKGMCKARLKARRQSLKAMLRKVNQG